MTDRQLLEAALRTIESFKPLVHAARKVVEIEMAYRRECEPGTIGAKRAELDGARSYWIDELKYATEGYPSTDDRGEEG